MTWPSRRTSSRAWLAGVTDDLASHPAGHSDACEICQRVLPGIGEDVPPWHPTLAVMVVSLRPDPKGSRRVKRLNTTSKYRGRSQFPCILCGYTIKKTETAEHLRSGECHQNRAIQRQKLEREEQERARS